MLVSGFMVPADKVVKCSEFDPIQTAVDLLIEKKISCVIVMGNEENPAGIVTKTDIVAAYKAGTSLQEKVKAIMNRDLKIVKDTDDRDHAAKILEHIETHHAIVLDNNNKFAGLISVWDIAAECARDSRAWPWTRAADGKVHSATGVF